MIVEISVGELLDKISILAIKLSKIQDTDKLRNISKEMRVLTTATPKGILEDPLYQELCGINMQLWDIEDEIRELERNKDFNSDFIRLARAVYFTNDKRADVKKQINLKYHSNIIEEKSYKEY